MQTEKVTDTQPKLEADQIDQENPVYPDQVKIDLSVEESKDGTDSPTKKTTKDDDEMKQIDNAEKLLCKYCDDWLIWSKISETRLLIWRFNLNLEELLKSAE